MRCSLCGSEYSGWSWRYIDGDRVAHGYRCSCGNTLDRRYYPRNLERLRLARAKRQAMQSA